MGVVGVARNTLTNFDLEVLSAVPESADDPYRLRDGIAITFGDAADILGVDPSETHLALVALEGCAYVRSTLDRSRNCRVWWRTSDGDAMTATWAA